ncbi:MAG: ferritin-like domain-containing protein [Pyrinomonadaceae bacterium]
MSFETNKDVLDWYERQPRTLTPEFINSIPWHQVNDHPLDEKFIPVLLYMRDVETLTDMYHRQMLRTPTGKDPYINKFMERWGVEEITHGEVINRFLNEIGFHTDKNWQTQVRKAVTNYYHASTYITTMICNIFGRKFSATHMTTGAIHEMEAAQGYRRLMTLANHPVLTYIVEGIIREEAAHGSFYRNIALLELKRDKAAQKIARYLVEKFWVPVGQGSLLKSRTEYMVTTLFGDDEGLSLLDTTVTQRLQALPGFANITTINDTMERIVNNHSEKMNAAVPAVA